MSCYVSSHKIRRGNACKGVCVSLFISGIDSHIPVGTVVPSEGFWGACENFRIFIKSFKCLFNFLIIQ
jgi:hypothetical protein